MDHTEYLQKLRSLAKKATIAQGVDASGTATRVQAALPEEQAALSEASV